jgi:protease-4
MTTPNKKMSAGRIVGFVFLGLFVLCLFSSACFIGGLALGGFSNAFTGGSMASGADSISLIRMEGVISGSQSSGLLGGTSITPESIIEQLISAEKNPGVKAIIIRVNSGGGSAAASQEIFEELKKIKKPVVVSVGDICASGAYYISCAADKIVANRSSSIGSIGVIMQITNLEELYKKLGITYTTIKAGKYKDAGSPDRPLTDEEQGLLQEQTFKVYDQFINDVAQSRNIPVEKVKEIATGWVYLGTEALDLGLIDKIGTYKDAERLAAELAGIKGEPNIMGAAQFNIWDMFLNYSFNQFAKRIMGLYENQAAAIFK